MGDDLQTIRNCICASASGVRLGHIIDMLSSLSLKRKLKVISIFFQYNGFAFKEVYDSYCVYFIREPDIWKDVFSTSGFIMEEN